MILKKTTYSHDLTKQSWKRKGHFWHPGPLLCSSQSRTLQNFRTDTVFLLSTFRPLLTPRCVKCAGDHPTKSCAKSKEEPATCCNCNGNRNANFSPFYTDLSKTKQTQKPNLPTTQEIPTKTKPDQKNPLKENLLQSKLSRTNPRKKYDHGSCVSSWMTGICQRFTDPLM